MLRYGLSWSWCEKEVCYPYISHIYLCPFSFQVISYSIFNSSTVETSMGSWGNFHLLMVLCEKDNFLTSALRLGLYILKEWPLLLLTLASLKKDFPVNGYKSFEHSACLWKGLVWQLRSFRIRYIMLSLYHFSGSDLFIYFFSITMSSLQYGRHAWKQWSKCGMMTALNRRWYRSLLDFFEF